MNAGSWTCNVVANVVVKPALTDSIDDVKQKNVQ